MNNERTSINFHESFSLSRPALSQLITAVTSGLFGKGLHQFLRQHTSLGENYIKAMPRYAVRCGLTTPKYELTTFGKFLPNYDPYLESLGTQWLMHYHLSASHGPGPAFWHELVVTRFRSGERFTGVEITDQIGAFVQTATGKAIAPRSIRSTATVFLGTYHKLDGLGKLGILKEDTKDHYRVLAPSSPSLWALAYALMDYWRAHYAERLTINLDDLSAKRGFASLFLMGEDQLLKVLSELQAEGVVELYRVAQPYQVVLLQTNPEYGLQRLYPA